MSVNKIIGALPSGTILTGGQNQYRIEKPLGQGGYGITYLATAKVKAGNVWVKGQFAIKEHFDQKLNYRVGTTAAISNPSMELEIRESVKSFMVEAKRLSELHHPNIVPVNESFEANNTAYYVMQYIDGGNLTEMVKSAPHGHLSEEKALDIIKQIAVSIDYLHSKRMTHLDVKPDNVVMQDGNTPILIDFGLVKRYDKTGKPTTTNKAAGVSDGYAPLEQYAGITEFTPEADVYALAATLLFMLTGKIPNKAGQMTPSEISSWLKDVASQHTTNAIIHGMAVLKDNRTKSVGQLLHELESGGSNGGEQGETEGSNPEGANGGSSEEVNNGGRITKKLPPHPNPRPNRNYAWMIGIGVILVFIIIMYLGASKSSTDAAEDVSITNSDTIWNTILSPSGETMFSWWGIVDLNGKPQGEGVIKYRDGDKDGRLRYEGMMKDGLRESETAKLFYTNGNSYEGSFVNDQFKEGKLILKSDGMYYVGTFKSDEPYNGKWYSISNGKEYSQVHNGVEK